jgi:hypothetical protein
MKFYPTLFAACAIAAPLHLAEGPEVQTALDHISGDSLRGNLSFLSSDALEGRETPSRGLDVAAEFIASQFRRAGLEAPVNNNYFQVADYYLLTRRTDGVSLSIVNAGGTTQVEPKDVVIVRGNTALNVESVPIFKLSGDSVPDEVAGKAVVIRSRGGASLSRTLREKKVALIVTTGSGRGRRTGPDLVSADLADVPGIPTVSVRGDAAAKVFESLPDGVTSATLSLYAPPPKREAVKLRNVIGVLRGSDPDLKNTYILVTAHYDHLGMKAPQGNDDNSDRIYNGANDDGSGVVSVIELAGALSAMHPRPRRSIVFMTVFGEEKGLLGSQYYGQHPVFPLAQTVADINIEQVGRTDDNESPQIAAATFTGFTYSDLPALFADAGRTAGVKVYDRNTGNDPYFARSDNQALADAGIPAHTVAVALEYPDYHQPGDEWTKIDYNNMTLIDRMLGLGIISLGNDPESPKWTESNPNTAKYAGAWRKLHPTLTK